jgi:hypothetical protein
MYFVHKDIKNYPIPGQENVREKAFYILDSLHLYQV